MVCTVFEYNYVVTKKITKKITRCPLQVTKDRMSISLYRNGKRKKSDHKKTHPVLPYTKSHYQYVITLPQGRHQYVTLQIRLTPRYHPTHLVNIKILLYT